MTSTTFAKRKVLAVGSGVTEIARHALPGAWLEVAGPERLLRRWKAGEAPDLVLIDAGCASAGDLVTAIEALVAAGSLPAAILVGAQLPVPLVRALLRAPRSDVLETPFTAADLAAAAASLMAPQAGAAPQAPSSKLWTVTGAVGGSGATTVAVETACALAQRSRERGVLLVDLNLADGAAAAYLGAGANMLLARAAPERIDPALLDAFSSPAPGGFDLLASARDPQAFERTPPEVVIRLLDVACQVYDYVVVDAPRHRHPWSLDVFSGSDEMVVVSELTVPALIAARSLVAEIERDAPAGPAPRIVLNRLSKRVFGPAPSIGEAEKALQRRADGGITSDWEAAAASVNLGGPIAHHRPRSHIVKDVGSLVDRMIAHPTPRTAPADVKAA